MVTLRAPRFVPAVMALTVAAVALAGCSGTSGETGPGGSSASSVASGPVTTPAGIYAAPLPGPLVLAQGVSSANPAHLFRSQAWDFTAMRAVFDAVSLLPGDQATVQEARRAGLAVVLEFDYKK
jgi:hypothetical protein